MAFVRASASEYRKLFSSSPRKKRAGEGEKPHSGGDQAPVPALVQYAAIWRESKSFPRVTDPPADTMQG